MHKIHILASLAVAGALALPAYGAPDDGAMYETLLASKAPAVVSVKFVLHVTARGETQEMNQEIHGTIVDATGVVMVGNDEFDGQMGAMKSIMKAQGMEVTMAPADVKILFGSESKEYPAVIVARDSNLGLAFVQILDLEGKTPDAVDLTKGATPKIGQAAYGVTRKSRGFDCAPTIDRLFVNGKVEKPRALWSVSGTFGGKGLPVFDSEGKPLGVYSVQKGSEGVEEGGGGPGGFLSALSGASEGSCLLPLDAVLKSLDQAKKRIPDAVAKAKEAAAKEKEASKEPAKEPAMDGATPETPKAPDVPKAPDAPKPPDAPKEDKPK